MLSQHLSLWWLSGQPDLKRPYSSLQNSDMQIYTHPQWGRCAPWRGRTDTCPSRPPGPPCWGWNSRRSESTGRRRTQVLEGRSALLSSHDNRELFVCLRRTSSTRLSRHISIMRNLTRAPTFTRPTDPPVVTYLFPTAQTLIWLLCGFCHRGVTPVSADLATTPSRSQCPHAYSQHRCTWAGRRRCHRCRGACGCSSAEIECSWSTRSVWERWEAVRCGFDEAIQTEKL